MNAGHMKQYVVYHNAAKQRPLPSEGEFFVFATKSIKHLLEQRVWVISGEGKSTPKSYFLRYTFEVDRVEEGSPSRAYGVNGRRFSPPVQLDFLNGFSDFLKGQQHFSLGVRLLDEDEVEFLRSIIPSA
jgi:hypothetical protein